MSDYTKKFRMWFERDGRVIFGDGRARLLNLIAETGSLRKAAEEMEMSYRHAWGVIKEMNESAGEPMVISERGGSRGGSTLLTALAENLLAEYEKSRGGMEKTLKYGRIDVAADAVILMGENVVLIKRKNEPYRGMYALPGGFLEDGETLEECVLREVKEETALICRIDGLIGVFSEIDRDPRGRTVSAAYLLRPVSEDIAPAPGDDASEIKLVPLSEIEGKKLAFDHARIIKRCAEGRF